MSSLSTTALRSTVGNAMLHAMITNDLRTAQTNVINAVLDAAANAAEERASHMTKSFGDENSRDHYIQVAEFIRSLKETL